MDWPAQHIPPYAHPLPLHTPCFYTLWFYTPCCHCSTCSSISYRRWHVYWSRQCLHTYIPSHFCVSHLVRLSIQLAPLWLRSFCRLDGITHSWWFRSTRRTYATITSHDYESVVYNKGILWIKSSDKYNWACNDITNLNKWRNSWFFQNVSRCLKYKPQSLPNHEIIWVVPMYMRLRDYMSIRKSLNGCNIPQSMNRRKFNRVAPRMELSLLWPSNCSLFF
jgi:hypothetical protein